MGHVQVRGLAHPEHWQGPQGQLFDRFGAVKASPMAAYKLLRQGESVLLFPGGGREVCLIWPQLKHCFVSGVDRQCHCAASTIQLVEPL